MAKRVIKISDDEGRVIIDSPKHRLSDKDVISRPASGKPGEPKEAT